jgi:hypothetical protein
MTFCYRNLNGLRQPGTDFTIQICPYNGQKNVSILHELFLEDELKFLLLKNSNSHSNLCPHVSTYVVYSSVCVCVLLGIEPSPSLVFMPNLPATHLRKCTHTQHRWYTLLSASLISHNAVWQKVLFVRTYDTIMIC